MWARFNFVIHCLCSLFDFPPNGLAYSWLPEDEPLFILGNIFFSATIKILLFLVWISIEKAQLLHDGVSWHFKWTFMVGRGWILITFMTHFLYCHCKNPWDLVQFSSKISLHLSIELVSHFKQMFMVARGWIMFTSGDPFFSSPTVFTCLVFSEMSQQLLNFLFCLFTFSIMLRLAFSINHHSV